MNRRRAAYDLPPLRLNRNLALAAQDRLEDMMSRHYFDHIAPDGMAPWLWVRRHGYLWQEVAENLATGFRTERGVVNGWMRSPWHRATMLGNYVEVGLASVEAIPHRQGKGHTVVAIYARPRAEVVAAR
ncbi:MAG TPA: CAP domain-containing protein [Thermoanaerobaculia bacterium]|nr:CAP domain-containing protein [Thermoanaerobaculia bacterium]